MKRRDFLRLSSSLATFPILTACDPAPRQAPLGEGSVQGTIGPFEFVDPGRWADFLEGWRTTALDIIRTGSVEFNPTLAAFRRSGRLARPAATNAEIQRREEALGIRLPGTFSAFLQASNGWRSPWRESGWTVLPLEQVDWLPTVDPQLIRDWRRFDWFPVSDSRYFRYGSEQDPADVRLRYLSRCIALSSTREDASVHLLNTAVVTFEGEIEAWELDHRLPGANRYRSFAGLMTAIRDEELELLRYWAGHG